MPLKFAPARLWAEFLALFGVVPVLMAVFFGQYPLFPVVLAFTVLAMVLLSQIPDFTTRELLRGPVLDQWKLIAAFTLASVVLTFGIALALVPERFLELPRQRPEIWLMIMLIYPLISALPQELIFRALFFRRYGTLFRNDRIALTINAAAFGLAHLFYMNLLTIGLATMAGLIFGLVYLRFGSILLATVLHAVAGQLIFTSGLGIYFYHGAVGQMP